MTSSKLLNKDEQKQHAEAMKLYIQLVLGSVMLNPHVDENSEYFKRFSGWVASQRKVWKTQNVLLAAIYHKEHSRNFHGPFLQTQEGFILSDNMFPWAVFGCHVLLDYCTDAAEVIKFLQRVGFQTPPQEAIQAILDWSSYQMRMKLRPQKQLFFNRIFSILTSNKPGFFEVGRSQYIKETWKNVYEHHTGHSGLNKMKDKGGIVFFALVCLEKNLYSVLYMDAMTEAVEFSRTFNTNPDFENEKNFKSMSCEVTIRISSFLTEYGDPSFMVLLNPLSHWLNQVLDMAVRKLEVPCDTQFVAPVKKNDSNPLVFKRVKPFLSMIAKFMDNKDNQNSPSYSDFKTKSTSWRVTSAKNIHKVQHQLFSRHPKTNVKKAKKLLVRKIPCLEFVSTDAATLRLLTAKPPKSLQSVKEDPKVRKVLESAPQFADMIKTIDMFSLSSQKEYITILVDPLSKKMLLYLFEAYEIFKRGESLDRDKTIRYVDNFVNRDMGDNWESKGVEFFKGGGFEPAEPLKQKLGAARGEKESAGGGWKENPKKKSTLYPHLLPTPDTSPKRPSDIAAEIKAACKRFIETPTEPQ
ncbi:hypothetical protein CJU89_6210 [Yarrowia sp. B02]|nr:hypothetical protein CJU89_6210 [Yarrowia sp. B02]